MFYFKTNGILLTLVDSESGLWVKWLKGAFDETNDFGRCNFIIDPYSDRGIAYDQKKRQMILWIKKYLPEYI